LGGARGSVICVRYQRIWGFAIGLCSLVAACGGGEAAPAAIVVRSVDGPVGVCAAGCIALWARRKRVRGGLSGRFGGLGGGAQDYAGRAGFFLRLKWGAILDLSDEAAISLVHEGAARIVQIDRGTVALEMSAGASSIELRVVDRLLAIGRHIGLRASRFRASATDHALVTVRPRPRRGSVARRESR